MLEVNIRVYFLKVKQKFYLLNDYAFKYTLNDEGKIVSQKEYLSDLLLVTQLYGQEICGEKKKF